MSMPPPLPPSPQAWMQPPMPAPAQAPADSRPAWRRGHPGWALLHLLIGVGVWFAGLFLFGIVAGVAGRTGSELDAISDAASGTVLLFLAASLVGWVLFAYSRGSTARRWATFGCITGGAWLIMVAVVLDATS